MKPHTPSRVDDSVKRTWDNCEAVLSPLKFPLNMFAQFPSPNFCTAAISSRSSDLDHGFLFFFWVKFPSNPPADETVRDGCFWTEYGMVEQDGASELSERPFNDWPFGIFVVKEASTVELFVIANSLGKPEAISTWTRQYFWMTDRIWATRWGNKERLSFCKQFSNLNLKLKDYKNMISLCASCM